MDNPSNGSFVVNKYILVTRLYLQYRQNQRTLEILGRNVSSASVPTAYFWNHSCVIRSNQDNQELGPIKDLGQDYSEADSEKYVFI